MTVMEVFTLLLVLFAGGTFLLTTISFVIKIINNKDKKGSSYPLHAKS